MNCPLHTHIDDYVDGALALALTSAFEQHLSGCRSCAVEVDELRAIRTAAAALERRDVPPHVWTRIEAHLRDHDAAAPLAARRWPLFAAFRGVSWAPVAVGVCAVAIAVVAWSLRAPGVNAPGEPAGQIVSLVPLPESVDGELKLAEEHYESAIAGLEEITAAERAALDPQTSAVLDDSLSVIDSAIGESRAALTEQPSDTVARDSLFEALRSKVGLLQDTVSLINEMRQGDQDGVARAISGLNQ